MSLLLSLFSCNSGEIYYQYSELKEGKWDRQDTLYFTIDSTLFEVDKTYKIDLEITNNVNYPYQNVWIYSQMNLTNDSIFTNMAQEYLLADEFGKWEGSGFGSLYQTSMVFRNKIAFKEKRNYLIKIEHGMRDEPLLGIEKIGLKISKIE